MKAARLIFKGAGIWGLLVLVPLYFLEDRLNELQPPAMNHPEMFYGFVGVAIAWQLAFVVIGSDPARYRALMPAGMVEKFSYSGSLVVLYAKGRIPTLALLPGVVDGLLGVLFVFAWLRTGSAEPERLA